MFFAASTLQSFCNLSRSCDLQADEAEAEKKKKKTIQIVTRAEFEGQHLQWYKGMLVPLAWIIRASVKPPLRLKGTCRFWKNICCQPNAVCFRRVGAGQRQDAFCVLRRSIGSIHVCRRAPFFPARNMKTLFRHCHFACNF